MSKLEAVLSVYGKLKKSVFVDGEEICGWKVSDLNKKQLLKSFTNEEILMIENFLFSPKEITFVKCKMKNPNRVVHRLFH